MFIPQVARRLIEAFSRKGDTICDIFCGSGTALVESRVLGRNAYGIDLNPLAVFLAKAKTTEIDPRELNREYLNLLRLFATITKSDVTIPQFNNIDYWFKKNVIVDLARLKKAIKAIKKQAVRNFFLISFSETVRLASNTRNGEFKLFRIAPEKLTTHNPNVIEIYQKKTESNINGMASFYAEVDKNTWAKVIYGDSSKDNGLKESSIDLIITSPPYGDSRTTVAYGQFSRLSAQWIDMYKNANDASKLDGELLGGKATKDLAHSLGSEHLIDSIALISERDVKRAKEVISFYIDLEKCLKRANMFLSSGKYFCLVVGNRQVKQVRIPTDFIIAELGQSLGFTCEEIIVRNIPGKRMPIKNSPTNQTGMLEETMNRESIVVLRKN